jgi:glycosyltransferase involved in cell wall biosynthesis
MVKDTISVIVPAFNEEKNIASVINELSRLRDLYKVETIVIDDASSDKTAEIAKNEGVEKVISHKKNKGKGGAFKTGLTYATHEFIVQFDADGQLKASDIPKLINSLKEGADVVLGARYSLRNLFKSTNGTQTNLFGNIFVSLVATIFSGKLIIDVMTGLKAFKKNKIKKIIPKANDFAYEAEIVIRASRKGFKISTVNISCRKRKSGKSYLSPYKHGFAVIKTIIMTATSY